MPVNGFRTITTLKAKPEKGQRVKDLDGEEFTVLEVGLKYARCQNNKGGVRTIKFSDLIYGTEL